MSARKNRALAPIIGFVLILVIVFIGITIVVVGGQQVLSEDRAQVQHEQAELAVSELAAKADRVALGPGDIHTVNLDLGANEGADTMVRRGGRMRVVDSNGTELVNRSLGSFTYRSGETIISYQGGGVWRGVGNRTRMISPPQLHYQDGTLTLPIISITPGGDRSGSRVTIRQANTESNLGPGYVENEIIRLEIQSVHYIGWAEFFRTRVPGSRVQIDHANRTISARLGRLGYDNVEFESAIHAQGGGVMLSTGNYNLDGPVFTEGDLDDSFPAASHTGPLTEFAESDLEPIDPLIESRVSAANGSISPQDISGGTVLTGGNTYYDDDGVSLSTGDVVEADLSSGNITLIVDGDITMNNGVFRVTNPTGNNVLRIYTTGDVTMDSGAQMYVTPRPRTSVDARHLQIYGTSELQVGMRNGAYFEGVIYAPRDSEVSGSNTAFTGPSNKCDMPTGGYADTCIATGSPEVDGAITAGPASLEQAGDFRYDSNLASLSLTLRSTDVLPPELSYLHISSNEIVIEGAPESNETLLQSG